MAIDKALPNMTSGELDPLGVAEEQSELNIELTDDGGALVNDVPEMPQLPFDGNLAEVVPEDELGKMSDSLRAYYEDDKSSRQD